MKIVNTGATYKVNGGHDITGRFPCFCAIVRRKISDFTNLGVMTQKIIICSAEVKKKNTEIILWNCTKSRRLQSSFFRFADDQTHYLFAKEEINIRNKEDRSITISRSLRHRPNKYILCNLLGYFALWIYRLKKSRKILFHICELFEWWQQTHTHTLKKNATRK